MRFPLRNRHARDLVHTAGFTLIEVIVSMTILSIVLVSVFGVYSNIVVMSKRLELSRGLQQNARTIVETIAKDVREGGIAFECYAPSTTSPVGCDSGPHPTEYAGSGVTMFIVKGTPESCATATDCFIQYFLAKPTATIGEVACTDADAGTPGLCYIARRVVSAGSPVGDSTRLSDALTSVTQLRFFLSGVSAAGFSSQADQEGKVTMLFNLSLAPRQGLDSESADRLVIPIQTTITQKLYQTSH